MASQRKYIRNPKIRLWIALSIPILVAFITTITIPGAWFVWACILAVPAAIGAFLTVACLGIGIVYWVRTGYIVNPYRHGPWGDWKDGIKWP